MTDLALNPFKKGKKTEVEGVRKVDVEKDSQLEQWIETYRSLPRVQNDKNKKLFDNLKYPSLAPYKINMFLQHIIKTDNFIASEYSKYVITGHILSKLIQKSYDNGGNNFTLFTHNIIPFIGLKLNGTKDNKLKLNLIGDVAKNCGCYTNHIDLKIDGDCAELLGYHSNNLHCIVNGNVSYNSASRTTNSFFIVRGNADQAFGDNSENCHCIVDGNAGSCLGEQSRNSYFLIKGKTSDACGKYVSGCVFIVNGDAGVECGTSSDNSYFRIKGSTQIGDKDIEKCIFEIYKDVKPTYGARRMEDNLFKAYQKDSFDMLLKCIPPNSNNNIQLLDENKEVLKEVKK